MTTLAPVAPTPTRDGFEEASGTVRDWFLLSRLLKLLLPYWISVLASLLAS